MNLSRVLIYLASSAALLLFAAVASCQRLPEGALPPVVVMGTCTPSYFGHSDFLPSPSLVESVTESSIIVVGECVGIGYIYNGCGVSKDDPRPDPYNFCIVQTYNIQVERYLKGDGPTVVTYGQDEGHISDFRGAKADPSAQNILAAKCSYDGPRPLEVGSRYLLFLRDWAHSEQCLLGAGYPTHFALVGDEAVPKGRRNWQPPNGGDCARQPAAELIHKVEQYVAGILPTPTPTLTPRPTAHPADVRLEPPESSVKAGQTFTVPLTINTVSPVWALEFKLDYDPSVLRLEEVREGDFFGSWAEENGLSTMVFGNAKPSSGATPMPLGRSPAVVILLLGTKGAGPSGAGTVFTLRFTALSKGDARLALRDVKVARILPDEGRAPDMIGVRTSQSQLIVAAADE